MNLDINFLKLVQKTEQYPAGGGNFILLEPPRALLQRGWRLTPSDG